MVLLWLIGILLAAALILVTYKQRFSRSGKLAAKIPGPKFIPLAGNVLDLGRNPLELFNGFLQAANEYGGVIRYWVGSLLHIVDSDPRDIEFFLSSTSILMKTKGYDFLDLWLGTGLISADGGPKWHAHRKLLTPAFHFKILEGFTDVFNKNTNVLVKKLKCEVGKPSFDIEPYVSDLALDVICESAMGTPVNAQLQSHSRFAEALKEVTRAVMNRIFKPWLFPKLLFDMSSIGKTYNHNLKYILDFVDQVIEKKKKLHEENKLNMDGHEKHTEEYDISKKCAFLDLMLQYRDADSAALSDMDIRDEVNTFMFAGQDTTTSAISFALYELAKHPEIQEKVVEELNEIFSGSDREETYQDLQNMKYLERVIKETLRMYTTVPLIGRQLTHDVTVPSGYTLPEGSMVLLFLYKLHHNPEIYTNPEEFNPDNFLLENVQNRGPFAFCPFSAGPRNCIGQKFAMLEMKSTLSSVLRKYRLFPSESGPSVILTNEIVLRSATGVHVHIENRMLTLWLIGFITIYAVLYIMYNQTFSRIGKIAAKLPGPRPVFLLGNVFEFSEIPGEFIYGLLKLFNNYGNVCRMWLGPSLYVLISGLEDLEFFLSSNSILKKAKIYEFLDKWLGTGLLTADGGPKWFAHRKLLTPAFHFKVLEEFIDVFNRNANILTNKLKCEVGKPDFDVEPYISDCALDIICESAMGTPVNAQMDSQSEFAQAIKDISTAIVNRSFKPWLFPKVLFDLSPSGRLHKRSLKYIHHFVDQVIIKKKKIHEDNKMRGNSNEKYTEEYGLRKKYAFLDLMLQHRDADSGTLSDMDIREEVNTFMFAGHDTTMSAVSFTLYAIAKHPEVQNEAIKELKEIFGDSDREETYQDLQNMKYLERVIKESMRLYSTVPFIGRRLVKDVTLPSGYTLPEGASVILFLHKLHHNPKYFPNPEEFNPDNFLTETASARPPFAYCPFSAGPRNCIGQKFAMLEMKAILSSVLRKYRLLPSESGPEVKILSELVLRSSTGMHIRIEKRK